MAVATDSRAADLLASVEELLPEIRARVDEIEELRTVPMPLIDELRSRGVFRLFVPHVYGGFELDPLLYLRLTELIATADASTAWVTMIAMSSGLMSAYLEPEGAQEIFGDPNTIMCGAGLAGPTGKASPVGDGWVVNGRWAFGSGCRHATWHMGGALLFDGEEQQFMADGRPEIRGFIFPADEVEIVDTWDVVGLVGTGSDDIAVTEAFVPKHRVLELFGAEPRLDSPLYTTDVFGILPIGVAAVGLGNARKAIDALVELAGSKVPRDGRQTLRDDERIQIHIARAEGHLRSARSYLYETLGAAWDDALAGRVTSMDLKAQMRLAASHAAQASAQAVDLMYHAGGTTSIRRSHPLQRCFRDAHVVTQHAMTNEASFGFAARALLDIPTNLQRF